MFGFEYIRLILPLDIRWRCPIGSLLSPLEIREGVRTGVVSIQVVFKTQNCISPSEDSVYI